MPPNQCLISDVSTFFCAYFQLICRKKVDEGKLPRIKNAYIYLYAISTGVLFHAVSWNMQIYHCFSFHDGKTQFVLRLRYVTSQHLEFGRIYVRQFSLNYVSYYPQKRKKGRSIILHLIMPVKKIGWQNCLKLTKQGIPGFRYQILQWSILSQTLTVHSM